MKRIVLLFFSLSALLMFLTPMELGDVWWHLATGKWIAQNYTLPQVDPFSITSTGSEGNLFVLKGFWLSQLIMHGVYSLSSIKGIIALKATLFAGALLLLYIINTKKGLDSPLNIICLTLPAFIATNYDETRPQTFTIFLFALLLYILETTRNNATKTPKVEDEADETEQEKQQTPVIHLMLLLVVLPLWSNIHPGYVAGLSFMILYLTEHLTLGLMKKRRYDYPFIVSCIGAFALCYLNPNGFEAIKLTYSMILTSLSGIIPIHEHMPLKGFTELTGTGSLYFAMVAFVSLIALSFMASRRKIDILHLVVFVILSYLSFKTFRAGIFLALSGSIILGANISRIEVLNRKPTRAIYISTIILLVAICGFVLLPRSIFKKPLTYKDITPKNAASFILKSKVPGNIYHPYEWGGYFIWRLYPDYRVFVDGRALGGVNLHSELLNAAPDWQRTLSKYNVNTVTYWPVLPYKGKVPPIIFELIKDKNWKPVYWDTVSLVFTRTEFAKHQLKKSTVWELLQSFVLLRVSQDPNNADNYVSLAEIYMARGFRRDTRNILKKALSLEPNHLKAKAMLIKLR